MIDVCVKIPKELNDIIGDTNSTLFVEALKEVAGKRIGHAEKRLDEFREKASVFEIKYGKSRQEFLQDMPDTPEAHDDWMEWTWLNKVITELSGKIDKFRLVAGQ
ncbi:MAG: hypothetical protein V2I97_09265 [Desulfococcaceae bacterium]|jgi:uncharacterized protein with LGFP repeats|nr:hypothetical protein [Desulfococcaceae bacterium]